MKDWGPLSSRWDTRHHNSTSAWPHGGQGGVHQSNRRTRDPLYMSDIEATNTSSTSTKWEWRHVKVKRAAVPPREQSAAGRPPRRLPLRTRRKPLGVRIWYRGGNHLDWTVEARGRRWAFDGCDALEDVMAVLLCEVRRPPGAEVIVEVSNERMFDACAHLSEGR